MGKQLSKEFVYTVKEVIPAEQWADVTYDPTIYTIKVTVVDNEAGVLHTTKVVEGAENITFVNYKTQPGEVQLNATKTLENKAIADGQFFFELSADDNSFAPQVVSNVGTSITFNPIKYTLQDVGVHTYTIKEKVLHPVTGYT